MLDSVVMWCLLLLLELFIVLNQENATVVKEILTKWLGFLFLNDVC